jgi:hypothetical protein
VAIGERRARRRGVSVQTPATAQAGGGGSRPPAVNTKDAQTIAARLHLDETEVRRVQARGYLLSLPFDDREIRERLLRAHRVYSALRLPRNAQSRI